MNFSFIKKSDALISIIMGLLIGFFFLISINVIESDLGIKWQSVWNYFVLLAFPIICFFGIVFISLLKKKILALYQFGKFALVGALNTFIDFGILNALISLTGIASGLYYTLFKSASFLIGATNSYFWNKHWTFGKKETVFSYKEFMKFFLVTFIGFLINVGTASFIVNIIGPQYGISEKLWANIGAFIAIFVAVLWNFFGQKYIVFKK